MIRKAVFPAAGFVTRFLPATKSSPKEMLPLVDKPLIQHGVEEGQGRRHPGHSAHLVLVPHILNWSIDRTINFIFDVLVQVGTLVSVINYFRKELGAIAIAFIKGFSNRTLFKEPQALLGWYLILATIPASVIGLALKDQVEQAFNSPIATALCLIVTALLLTASELIGKRNRSLGKLNWNDAIWIGFFQAVAIFPGISRSGATISGGLIRNLDRSSAAGQALARGHDQTG